MATAVSNSVTLPALNSTNGTLTDEYINGLVQGGSWQFGGGPHVITYSFNLNFDYDPDGGLIPGSGGAWTSPMTNAVNRALTAWSNVANISFQNISSGSYFYESNADIAFTLTGDELQTAFGAIGLGVIPDPVFADELRAGIGLTAAEYPNPTGDVFFDNYYSGYQYLDDGGFGYSAILHEIGHALGLKHPFDDGGNLRPTFAELGISENDLERWTIMSGNDNPGATLSAGNSASPMPLDILAIQQIYGANMSYRTGNDVYTLLPSFADPYSTIWDAGGVDTLDASSFIVSMDSGLTMDLRPGLGYVDNPSANDGFTAIAFGVTIENAIGTASHDTIIGNDANNVLDGNLGHDTMTGGLGNDTYVVSETNDVIVENAGEGVDAVLSKLTLALGANIENLTLDEAAGNANGTGNALANLITGNSFNNWLDGGGGVDTLVGGFGDDVYFINAAGDLVVEEAGAGTDAVRSTISYMLTPNLESVTLAGSANINATGNVGNNVLDGNAGRNVLDGGAGTDTLSGGSGDDIYVVDSSGDVISETPLTMSLASSATDGMQANGFSYSGIISDNGQFVAFQSYATNLVSGAGFTQQIYVKNLLTGDIKLVSSSSSGVAGNSISFAGDISADGRYVVFESASDNLVPGDTNGVTDVFLKDLISGFLTRVSTASDSAQSNNFSSGGDVSADGRFIVFSSSASNLVPGDSPFGGVFAKDTQTGVTTLVSTDSRQAMISANGRYVVFQSSASNLVLDDTNGAPDLFRKDLVTGTTVLVSSASDGTLSNADVLNGSSLGGVSADGRYVVFNSTATNLVAGDTNGEVDIFVKDLQTGLTTLVSSASNGTQGNSGSNGSSISADGRYVVFNSISTNLGGDTSSAFDVFVKDLQSGLITWVSVPAIGAQESPSFSGSISGDGRYVVFDSSAANLVAGDVNSIGDVFVAENPLYDPGGNDEVRSSASYTLSRYLEKLILAGSGNINGSGNDLGNIITGNGGNNALNGGAGNDTLTGGDGNDSLKGDAGDDSLNGGAGTDTASYAGAAGAVSVDLSIAGAQNTVSMGSDTLASIENLLGSAFNDTLTGSAGNNVLDGGVGADTMIGGAGNDTYVVNASNDVVTEGAGAGLDLVQASGSHALGANVENLILTGTGNISGFGNTLDNTLTGNSGNNTLSGGVGTDTASYANAGSAVSVNLSIAGAQNTVSMGNDTLTSIENLTGGNFNDTLTGSGGNNVLDGGLGADTMIGGAGNDTYVVNASNDVVTEGAGAGLDLVQASGSHALGANVENLILTGTGNISGFGNALDNTLTGNVANNTLSGGVGTDTASYANAGSAVSVNLSIAIAQNTVSMGSDTLASIENLLGSAFNDTLTGSAGNNVLDGGLGADTMIGGAGNDTYVVNASNDVVTEGAGAGLDLVQASGSHTLSVNVENLILTGASNISGFGNALDNTLTGNSGNNTLNGGVGTDTASYANAGSAVSVDLSVVIAQNTVSMGSDTLANIENLLGSAFNDTLTGSAGNNVLDGGVGADTMIGGAGNDTYVVNASNDVVTEGAGAGLDLVQASGSYTLSVNVENLTLTGASNIAGFGNALGNILTGNSGNNSLSSGAGNDTLIGGSGSDQLTGGGDSDTFDYNALADAGDTIIGFTAGAGGDKLDIDTLLTVLGYGGVDPLADGYVRVLQSGLDSLLQIDSDGGGDSFATTLATLQNVTAANVTLADNFMV